MRVTHTMLFNNAQTHIQRQSARVFRAREDVASGKKVRFPSDDASATRRILDLRGTLASVEQFGRNRDTINTLLRTTDTALQDSSNLLIRAKELAVAGANDILTRSDRAAIAAEVAQLFDQAVQIGNTNVGGRHIFAGRATDQPPFTVEGMQGVRFSGDNTPVELSMSAGQNIAVNVNSAEFLVADLRPNLDVNTRLSSLRQGQGISAGSITITDRVGGTATIDLATAMTVGEVLTAISENTDVHVTATLNPAGMGIVVADDNAVPTQNLTIAEFGAGTTASDLGIAADRPGSIVGASLKPILTQFTPLALLHQGQGVSLGTLHIANGALEDEIDLSGAQTVGDVLAAISGSNANVTAQINVTGTALDVRSNDPTTVAVVTDADGGATAADLGIQGPQDTLKTLSLLHEALEQNDRQAIDHLLTHIDAGIERISTLRAEVGARENRVEFVETSQEELQISVTTRLSETEDTDVVEAITRLTHYSNALQVALATTARTIQPTLLDFLR